MRKLISAFERARIFLAVLFLSATIAGALTYLTPMASAQVPSLPGPYNIDLGKVLVMSNVTNVGVSSPTGSTYSATPVNYVYSGLICTMTVTATSGSPTISWNIQQYDAASQSWFTLLTMTDAASLNAALPATQVAEIAPAIQTSTLPTNMYAIELLVPRVWRVNLATTSAVMGVTGYVGCNLTKGP